MAASSNMQHRVGIEVPLAVPDKIGHSQHGFDSPHTRPVDVAALKRAGSFAPRSFHRAFFVGKRR